MSSVEQKNQKTFRKTSFFSIFQRLTIHRTHVIYGDHNYLISTHKASDIVKQYDSYIERIDQYLNAPNLSATEKAKRKTAAEEEFKLFEQPLNWAKKINKSYNLVLVYYYIGK